MLLCRDYLILLDVPELEPDRSEGTRWTLYGVPELEPDRFDPDAALQGLFDPF
jgi:hypothetical protein